MAACWQVLFVVVDVAGDTGHVLQYFGLKAEEAPTLRLVNVETTKKYAPEAGTPITAASVTAFCNSVLGGELKVSSWAVPGGGTVFWRPQGNTCCPPALPPEPGHPPGLGPAASQDSRGQELRAGGLRRDQERVRQVL